MKSIGLFCLLIASYLQVVAQGDLKIKQANFKTLSKTTISGEVGYLSVPENRSNPSSRRIKIKFIRLKSLSPNPKEPVVYLEGGGSACTWQADNPAYLSDWLTILNIADLILMDQRGTTDRKLIHIQKDDYFEDFFVSEESATSYYQDFCSEALSAFDKKEIDILGYNIEAHAKDVDELVDALGIEHYSIFGFSFGTSIGMAIMKQYEDRIANAILVGADGIEQSFNYPSFFDQQFDKIAEMLRQDTTISKTIPDLNALLDRVMQKLTTTPVEVSVRHPLNKKSMSVKVGPFGLALILRLDIDDIHDIPIIPRLLYSIDQGDYSILAWFIQKRIKFAIGLPGQGINQGIASGVSTEREQRIFQEAAASVFGNVVNFPFSAALDAWPETTLSFDTTNPLISNVRTLFITGDLDCRTPVKQVEELKNGFSEATHLIVQNAGHEQAMWAGVIWDEAIPQFLKGEEISNKSAVYRKEIKFIPLTSNEGAHPSLD